MGGPSVTNLGTALCSSQRLLSPATAASASNPPTHPYREHETHIAFWPRARAHSGQVCIPQPLLRPRPAPANILSSRRFSKEGDLLFSVSKDHVICAWYSANGERFGAYKGHQGALWTVDVDPTTTMLASGGADNTIRLWNVKTGKLLKTWEFGTAIKRVEFSEDGQLLLGVTEKRAGQLSTIIVYDINTEEPEDQPDEHTLRIVVAIFGLRHVRHRFEEAMRDAHEIQEVICDDQCEIEAVEEVFSSVHLRAPSPTDERSLSRVQR